MKIRGRVKLAIAGIIGCGLCSLPILLPVMAGALGISILGISLIHILCGVFFLFLAVAAYGLYLSKRKRMCVLPSAD